MAWALLAPPLLRRLNAGHFGATGRPHQAVIMNIGFIGTGSIAQAVIRGLYTCAQPPDEIWVSPRNPNRAQHLAATYARVTVAESNQAVVNHCNWVFITVKPDIADAVLA